MIDKKKSQKLQKNHFFGFYNPKKTFFLELISEWFQLKIQIFNFENGKQLKIPEMSCCKVWANNNKSP